MKKCLTALAWPAVVALTVLTVGAIALNAIHSDYSGIVEMRLDQDGGNFKIDGSSKE